MNNQYNPTKQLNTDSDNYYDIDNCTLENDDIKSINFHTSDMNRQLTQRRDLNTSILSARLLAKNKVDKKMPVADITYHLNVLTNALKASSEFDSFTIMDILTNAYALELLGVYTNKLPNPIVQNSPDLVLKYLVEWEINWTKNFSSQNMRAHPSAKNFPGMVSTKVPTVDMTLTINGTVDGMPSAFGFSGPNNVVWFSTGIYANAGKSITVEVPETLKSSIYVIIGCHKDEIHKKRAQMARFPTVTRQYTIQQSIDKYTSAFGGLVYIGVKPFSKLGLFNVNIKDGFRAPTYFIDQTTDAQWDILKINTVPWGEIVGNNIICTYPQGWLKTLKNPRQIAEYWDDVGRYADNMVGIDRHIIRPERIVLDIQIGRGAMHAGYPIMGHTYTKHQNMLNYTHCTTEGHWGPFHEIGHNHQHQTWALPAHLEVSCNIFAELLTNKLANNYRSNSETANLAKETAFKNMTTQNKGWNDVDGSVKIQFYLQLQQGFGWNKMKEFFSWYTHAKPSDISVSSVDAKINFFALRYSLTVGYNLTEYFRAWKFNLTQATIDAISHLPTWTDYHKNLKGGTKSDFTSRVTDPNDGVPLDNIILPESFEPNIDIDTFDEIDPDIEPQPIPVEPTPETLPKPTPVEPLPTPVEPTPLPTPVEPTPLPTPVEPTPLPTPVEPTPLPTPVEPTPLPTPETLPEPTPETLPETLPEATPLEPTPDATPVEPTPLPTPETLPEPTPLPTPEATPVEATPVEPTPETLPEATPVEPTPETLPEATPVEPTPETLPEPLPVEPQPTPVEPQPTPVEPTPEMKSSMVVKVINATKGTTHYICDGLTFDMVETDKIVIDIAINWNANAKKPDLVCKWNTNEL
jgi:hypothetical protein